MVFLKMVQIILVKLGPTQRTEQKPPDLGKPSVAEIPTAASGSSCRDSGLFGSPVLCGLRLWSTWGPSWSPRVLFCGRELRSEGACACRGKLGHCQVGGLLLRSLTIDASHAVFWG